eukprot:3698177-Rhodomonas_salina.1
MPTNLGLQSQMEEPTRAESPRQMSPLASLWPRARMSPQLKVSQNLHVTCARGQKKNNLQSVHHDVRLVYLQSVHMCRRARAPLKVSRAHAAIQEVDTDSWVVRAEQALRALILETSRMLLDPKYDRQNGEEESKEKASAVLCACADSMHQDNRLDRNIQALDSAFKPRSRKSRRIKMAEEHVSGVDRRFKFFAEHVAQVFGPTTTTGRKKEPGVHESRLGIAMVALVANVMVSHVRCPCAAAGVAR